MWAISCNTNLESAISFLRDLSIENDDIFILIVRNCVFLNKNDEFIWTKWKIVCFILASMFCVSLTIAVVKCHRHINVKILWQWQKSTLLPVEAAKSTLTSLQTTSNQVFFISSLKWWVCLFSVNIGNNRNLLQSSVNRFRFQVQKWIHLVICNEYPWIVVIIFFNFLCILLICVFAAVAAYANTLCVHIFDVRRLAML